MAHGKNKAPRSVSSGDNEKWFIASKVKRRNKNKAAKASRKKNRSK